jgi:DNA recombination protein RmuC
MEGLPIIVAAVAAALVGGIVVIALLRRRGTGDAALLLLQQQMDALRAQMSQSLEAAAQAVASRTDALQIQVASRLDEVTRTVADRLNENAQAMHQVNQQLGQRLDTNLQVVGQRFTETSTMVTTVHEKLKELEEAAGRIFELGRDLSSLQEILRPPKLRGGVGEVLLENLLANGLPQGNYEMQHRFTGGTVVDAVIRLGGKFVPVDSKFPLEGFYAILRAESDDERARARREFLRGVQGHIKTIADKYILPAEGTYDFALMYVPAENVYYEAVVRGDEGGGVYTFAMERRVIPVSPTTFYAYLVALVYGLKGMQVERQAEQIRSGLAQLTVSFERIREPLDRLGEQIRRAQKNYEDANKALERFGSRLETLSGVALPEPEPQVLPLGEQSDS